MSGIEVAGIVLAAFPLALKALAKYQEVGEGYAGWKQMKYEYGKCRRAIALQQQTYEANLERLFSRLPLDETTVAALLQDPQCNEWEDATIVSHLKSRLSSSYDNYRATLVDIQRALEDLEKGFAVDKVEIQRRLDSEREAAVTLPPAPKNSYRPIQRLQKTSHDVQFEVYRLAFSVNKRPRETILKQLKELNDDLAKILENQEEVSRLREQRVQDRKRLMIKRGTSGDGLCRYADALYASLTAAWQCHCSQKHCARLQLQYCQSIEIDFNLVFQFQQQQSLIPTSAAHVWQLQATRIRTERKTVKKPVLAAQAQLNASASSAAVKSHRTLAPLKSILSSGKKRTSNGQPIKKATKIAATCPQPSISGEDNSAPPQVSSPTDQAIESLCRLFGSNCSTTCFGFVEHEETRYYVHALEQGSSLDAKDPITLKHLLEGRGTQRLNRRQKFYLARTLASSFAQLHGSVWMQSALHAADISFLRDALNPNVLLLDQPYITKDFNGPAAKQSAQQNIVTNIRTLGMILLELCLGDTIEALQARPPHVHEDGILPDSTPKDEREAYARRLLAAISLAVDLVVESNADYASAVDWCLLGSKRLTEVKEWRDEFNAEVVAPIERAYEALVT